MVETLISQGADVKDQIEQLADEEGLTVLGWREVPINPASIDLDKCYL